MKYFNFKRYKFSTIAKYINSISYKFLKDFNYIVFKRYTYHPNKIKVPKQYRLISKIFYLSFINFSKLGLKYFGPFITLPESLYMGFPSSPNLLILEF